MKLSRKNQLSNCIIEEESNDEIESENVLAATDSNFKTPKVRHESPSKSVRGGKVFHSNFKR